MSENMYLITVWGIKSLAIIGVAVLCICLGYKLFDKESSLQSGVINIKTALFNFAFQGKGMGIFFMLSGTLMVFFMIHNSKVSLDTILTETGFESHLDVTESHPEDSLAENRDENEDYGKDKL